MSARAAFGRIAPTDLDLDLVGWVVLTETSDVSGSCVVHQMQVGPPEGWIGLSWRVLNARGKSYQPALRPAATGIRFAPAGLPAIAGAVAGAPAVLGTGPAGVQARHERQVWGPL